MNFENVGLSVFGIVVNKATDGKAVPNAEVQIIGTDGANYIGTVTGGVSPAYTNENGGIYYSPVPAGSMGGTVAPFVLRVIADGYKVYSYNLPSTYTGPALISVELERGSNVADGYSLTGQSPRYRSSMYDTVLTALTPHSSAWEIIQFGIVRNADPASILEVPVLDDDGEGGIVRGNLKSRADLLPLPHLVSDGQASLVDDYFSAVYTVSATSLTDAGDAVYDDTLTYFLANMVPNAAYGASDPNDLSDYALPVPVIDAPSRLIKWITQLTSPIVFRGYYADVMIWLVDKSLTYTLVTRYLDAGGNLVGDEVQTELPGDSRVQRIRIDANPDDMVRFATLQVLVGTDAYSERLTVTYRG